MPVIEHQRGQASLGEPTRIRLQRCVACGTEPVRHDDARRAGRVGRRPIPPRAARHAVAGERDFRPFVGAPGFAHGSGETPNNRACAHITNTPYSTSPPTTAIASLYLEGGAT